MNGIKIILFPLFCVFYLLSGSINAQTIEPATISGTVIDSTTNNPLLGAHVFLSGTSLGTSTDHAGRFILSNLPPGAHTFTISVIGYGRSSQDIVLKAGEEKIINRKLEPVVYDLGELYVGNLDERWERHLARFKNLFIGETSRADSVTILNPEVLRFQTRWWGRFTAEALAPLQIENRATGYHITYHLDDFRHSGTVTRWDGDSFFTSLTPADSVQQEYWISQRNEAFMGSLQHFFLSLVKDELENQGFLIYLISRRNYGYPPTNRRRVTASRLVKETEDQDHYQIRYFGNLEIIYRGSEEEDGFSRWAGKTRGPANAQTSFLELDKRPITIDPNGEIMETYGATRKGYMAFMRYAEVLPKEYRPEGWSASENSYSFISH